MFRSMLLCGVLALALAGCAGVRTFDSDLRAFIGKPVNDAAIVYGPHTGQYTTKAGETVYVWQDSDVESVFGPAVTGGIGYQIGGSPASGNGLLWSGIKFHGCVIRITTMDGIVRAVTYQGDPGGCETIHGYKRKSLSRVAR